MRSRSTGLRVLFATGLLLMALVSGTRAAALAPGDSLRAVTATGGSLAGRSLLVASYGALYSGAAKVGSRLGLERRFRVQRLESAWAIDVFGHVYAVRHVSRLFGRIHRWAGDDPRTARRRGAWQAAFGAYLYMETINGFMPGVRFDWMDPISNAAGATLASEGPEWAREHPWMRRLSLELGYKDWGRLWKPDRDKGALTRVWHDYPNQRFGIGWGLGPLDREWLRVFATYDVTSFQIEELRNVFGVGVELKPHHWLAPWLRALPGGRTLLRGLEFLDRNLLLPGLYVQLWTVDAPPFSDREPFDE